MELHFNIFADNDADVRQPKPTVLILCMKTTKSLTVEKKLRWKRLRVQQVAAY